MDPWDNYFRLRDWDILIKRNLTLDWNIAMFCVKRTPYWTSCRLYWIAKRFLCVLMERRLYKATSFNFVHSFYFDLILFLYSSNFILRPSNFYSFLFLFFLRQKCKIEIWFFYFFCKIFLIDMIILLLFR